MSDPPTALDRPSTVDHPSLVVAVLAPAALVASEVLGWPTAAIDGGDNAETRVVALVGKIALVAWLVGRYVAVDWLRVAVFVWSVASIDLRFFSALTSGGRAAEAAAALLLAQLTTLVVWGLLIETRWVWRLPVLLLAFTSLVPVAAWGGDGWGFAAWTALIAPALLVVFAGVATLRRTGWRLRRAATRATKRVDAEVDAGAERPVTRFGVAHVLVWSAALAPLLSVSRTLGGGFRREAFRLNPWVDLITYPFAAIGLAAVIGVTTIATALLMLGQRQPAWRTVAFALFAFGTVVLGEALSTHVAGANLWAQPNWYGSLRWLLYQQQEEWFSWSLLAYGTLSALLLFLRASGYRLARDGRPPAQPERGTEHAPVSQESTSQASDRPAIR